MTQLPVGKYEISVERMGFKTFKREGVTLSAAQILRVDVRLEIRITSETVTVDAEASLLKTDTSAVVHNVTVSQIQNLPLTPINTGYPRDPLQFAQLLPGIRYVPTISMLVNGLPADQVQYRIDGQVMGNVRTLLSTLTAPVQPSVDSIPGSRDSNQQLRGRIRFARQRTLQFHDEVSHESVSRQCFRLRRE